LERDLALDDASPGLSSPEKKACFKAFSARSRKDWGSSFSNTAFGPFWSTDDCSENELHSDLIGKVGTQP